MLRTVSHPTNLPWGGRRLHRKSREEVHATASLSLLHCCCCLGALTGTPTDRRRALMDAGIPCYHVADVLVWDTAMLVPAARTAAPAARVDALFATRALLVNELALCVVCVGGGI